MIEKLDYRDNLRRVERENIRLRKETRQRQSALATAERERDKAERLLRVACAKAMGDDLGDQSLEWLRQRHSPELADIAIALDLAIERVRIERVAELEGALRTATECSKCGWCCACLAKASAALDAGARETPKGEPMKAVVITTKHRGVFFGRADDTSGNTITLKDARCAIYWSPETKGFMGLAVDGPGKKCRIGAKADIEVRDVTAVLECTPEAIERWEAAPWA